MIRIDITNDNTGTKQSANYKYVVCINDRVVEKGTIKGHDTSNGWRYLATLIGTPISFRTAIPHNTTIDSTQFLQNINDLNT